MLEHKANSRIPRWMLGVMMFTCGLVIGKTLAQVAEKLGLFV